MTICIDIPTEIQAELDADALFVISHSGGKDSQAMTALLRRIVPAERLVVVHAKLPEVDWSGVLEHVVATTASLEVVTCRAASTFFETVERRGMFPTPSQRQCTSDLKRTPIEVEIRRLCRERGISRVVSCQGMRAEESTNRARLAPVKLDKRLSKAGRHVLTWLPVHELTTDQVFAAIADAGQKPHWAYEAGMSRLSCCFCIMASRQDLTTAARLNPGLYRRYVETEKRLDFTLSPSRVPLEEITGIAVADQADAAEAFLERILEAADGLDQDLETVDLVAMATRPAAVLSFGAGVDSTALLAIELNRDRAAELLKVPRAELDRIVPPLDAVVFADTGAESKATYRNVQVAAELCAIAGLPFDTVFKTDREGNRYRIQDHHLRLGTLPIMPGCGHVCSLKFKQDPIRQWRAKRFDGREVVGLIGYEAGETGRAAKVDRKQGRQVEYQLGFEAGEGRRCAKAGRFKPEPDVKYRFPLVDLGLDRKACADLVAALWPIEVKKSSCIFCPFMTRPEIREIWQMDPEAWQLAKDLETALKRESDRKHGAYLEAIKAHEADPGRNPSPLNSVGKCKPGFWSRHTWNEGVRAFWGAKINGKILSVDEWQALFEAEDLGERKMDRRHEPPIQLDAADHGGPLIFVSVVPAAGFRPRLRPGLGPRLAGIGQDNHLLSNSTDSAPPQRHNRSIMRPTHELAPEVVLAWRKRLGLTQQGAASALGITDRYVRDLERGRKSDGSAVKPSKTLALAMAALEAGLEPLEG